MHECTRKSFLPMTDTVWRATSGISDMMDMAVESHKATMEDLQDDDDSCAVDMQVDASNGQEAVLMTAFSDRSESIGSLAKSLVKALGELQDVVKTQTAKAGSFSYSYATIADALGMARPILAKHGLALMQTAEVDDREVMIHTTIMHESGEFLTHNPTRLPAGQDAQKTGFCHHLCSQVCDDVALGLAPRMMTGHQHLSVKHHLCRGHTRNLRRRSLQHRAFQTADKIDGLNFDERNALLRAVAKARDTNDATKGFVKSALNEANGELLSDLDDNNLEKLRRALNDIIIATTED